MMKWLFLSCTIVLTAGANILMKVVSSSRPSEAGATAMESLVRMALNPLFITGALCLAVALVPYTLALKKLDLSTAYPVMTTSVMLLVSVFSILIFKESFTVMKVMGMIAVIAGVTMLSL
jgi:multidrug transporter EmrE-like cation transporter